MDTYIKKNDRCHPLGFPDHSNSYGSFISERRKYYFIVAKLHSDTDEYFIRKCGTAVTVNLFAKNYHAIRMDNNK
jgi:hypothetical protein